MKACAVITTLNNWWSPCKNCTPGLDNSNLIKTEKAVPIIPENTENIKYKVPISLAFVEFNQFKIIFIYLITNLIVTYYFS